MTSSPLGLIENFNGKIKSKKEKIKKDKNQKKVI